MDGPGTAPTRPTVGSAPLPPHATFKDVLSAQEHAALLEWTLRSEALLRPSALVGGVVDPRSRASLSLPRERNGPWQAPLCRRLAELLPSLVEAAKAKPFELAEIDLKLVAYGDGDFFAPHSDTFTGAQRGATDRVLTAVYYFHREPQRFSGGELRLYAFGAAGAADDPFVAIQPRQNSLVVFPAWATHAVAPVAVPSGRFGDSRFAINCWLNRAAV